MLLTASRLAGNGRRSQCSVLATICSAGRLATAAAAVAGLVTAAAAATLC